MKSYLKAVEKKTRLWKGNRIFFTWKGITLSRTSRRCNFSPGDWIADSTNLGENSDHGDSIIVVMLVPESILRIEVCSLWINLTMTVAKARTK
jgi:hypothetical protein